MNNHVCLNACVQAVEGALRHKMDHYLNIPHGFVGCWNNEIVTEIPAHARIVEPIVLNLNDLEQVEKITIIAHNNSSVVIICDQNAVLDKNVFSHLQLIAHENAHISLCLMVTGASWSKLSLQAITRGTRARIDVTGIVALGDAQSAVVSTRQEHEVPYTSSSISIKGLLAGQSKLVYQGVIDIQKNALHANACQQNKNILCSSQSRAWSIPSLEVQTNEVKCTHGSATGPLDAEQVWYAQSRGLSVQQAQKLLLNGFVADVVAELPEWYRDRVMDRIMHKLFGVLS